MSESRLVYSTAGTGNCPGCNKPQRKCICKTGATKTGGDGVIRIQRESKGRKGKGVTLITGLNLDAKELKALAKTLKAHCGTGGTVKADVIEIQGDHREKLKHYLEKSYSQVKLAGG